VTNKKKVKNVFTSMGWVLVGAVWWFNCYGRQPAWGL